MAKIKHNNFLDTVHDVFTDAIQEGVLHLYAEDTEFSGRTIRVDNKALYHFGTTGYLGLEQDHRLKSAAIQAIQKYGTQFPLSKSYISNPLYRTLEERITQMYKTPIIITKNSTLGHLGVIPSAVRDQDAIILDHQVHWSVQSAAKVLKNRSVPVDMIRHNDLNMLEDKIKTLSQKNEAIWYMMDGIYSMYGDSAPLKDLQVLCSKYPQLHLYIDDVHGMSWIGKHGTGYALHELGELTDNILLFGTLSKTFGASGAVLACTNKKKYQAIKTFGGPLTFSAQLEPASVAAAIASADIHLSPEIYNLQAGLRERIDHFKTLLKATDLPLIDTNNSPVFFIGTGMPQTGYNFVNRLMKEGFYVNLGLFPAVPVKNTGVRITISRHNQKQDMTDLVAAMAYHYPKSLEETQTTQQRVCQAFKLKVPSHIEDIKPPEKLRVQLETTILNIDTSLWDAQVGKHGGCDWEGLKFLEETFSGHALREHNWRFWYVMIYDQNQNPMLSTVFSLSLWKDDMLAHEKASQTLERQRLDNPYYMTSNVLSMGTLFTEGTHLYIDPIHPLKQQAMQLLMQTVETLERDTQAKMVVLRDFPRTTDWHPYFQGQGFVRIHMPDTCNLSLESHTDMESLVASWSSKSKRHLRKEILAWEPLLNIQVLQTANQDQIEQIQQLYTHVHQNNLGLNTFPFPMQVFQNMATHSNWEFITISLPETPEKLIGVMCCYKNHKEVFVPAFVGMDYTVNTQYHIYRQLLYQTIKRAMTLNFKQVDFGMTAAFEKRKLGATVNEAFAYIQTSDNFALELMGLLEERPT